MRHILNPYTVLKITGTLTHPLLMHFRQDIDTSLKCVQYVALGSTVQRHTLILGTVPKICSAWVLIHRT